MRYLGSKASTIDPLFSLVTSRVERGTFCDPFGGIAVVGSFFKLKGFTVWTGDIVTFAHLFQIAKVEAGGPPAFRKLFKHFRTVSVDRVVCALNGLAPKDGWFVTEYAIKRRFFTLENARRIEACRQLINRWVENGMVTDTEAAILIASLINSFDKIANTAGTYYAYLKGWHAKALRPFRFELIPWTPGNSDCRSFLMEAQELLRGREYDVIYLDPPYNDRCYAGYYHLPETIAQLATPAVFGKAGVPCREKPISAFNYRSKASSALEGLLAVANFRLLVFHYSDKGIIPPHQVRGILNSFGKIEDHVVFSKGYTTNSSSGRMTEHHLYLLER
jgi:adenine-specific DNA-methyltransferase